MNCLETQVFGNHSPTPFRLITHRSASSTSGYQRLWMALL